MMLAGGSASGRRQGRPGWVFVKCDKLAITDPPLFFGVGRRPTFTAKNNSLIVDWQKNRFWDLLQACEYGLPQDTAPRIEDSLAV